jgi:hypothetical protein
MSERHWKPATMTMRIAGKSQALSPSQPTVACPIAA